MQEHRFQKGDRGHTSEFSPADRAIAKSHSAFRELRLKAGFDRYQIARDIGVTYPTVRGWDRGGRPRLGHLRRIAELFNMDLLAAIERIWGEAVDDPCGEHCSGKKVLPGDDEAPHLWIELSCQKCERAKKKPHRKGVHRHSKVCRNCYEDELVTLTCTGYAPPFRAAKARSERAWRHARSCKPPYQATKPRRRFKFHGTIRHPKGYRGPTEWIAGGPRTVDDGVHSFIDEKNKTYRCKACMIVICGIYDKKRHVIEFLTGAKKYYLGVSRFKSENKFDKIMGFACAGPIQTIDSEAKLRDLRRRCYRLWSYVDEEGKEVFFDDNVRRPIEQNREKKMSRPNGPEIPPELRHAAGGIVMQWTPKSTGKLVGELFASGDPEDYFKLREEDPAKAQELLGGKDLVVMKIDGEWLICKIPASVRGLCSFCHTVVISTWAATDHMDCLIKGTILPDPHAKGGRPLSVESLPMYLVWAILNKLGARGAPKIAKEFRFSDSNVQDRIKSVLNLLPEEEQKVAARFSKMVLLLRLFA